MKTGHGSKLARKQEVAVAALLVQPTIAKAAEAAGVADKTLDRWMKQPDFAKRYREARGVAIVHAVGRLAGALAEAVHTMRQLQKSTSPAVALGAAKAIVDLTLRGESLVDLSARVAALEARLEEVGPGATVVQPMQPPIEIEGRTNQEGMASMEAT